MKRRLNKQQHRRIKSAQENRIEAAFSHLGDEQQGLVITHFGNSVEVEFNHQTIRCHSRQNIGSIVVGDNVIFCLDLDAPEPIGIVTARLDRRSLLTRPDVYKQQKDIAANIDQMFIVAAIEPEPIPHFIDKYLVAAELQGIEPIIFINKMDLFDPIRDAKIEKLIDIYEGIGYQTVYTSVHKELDAIKTLANDKNSIFVGQSGVGKSALINALFQDNITEVGAISAQNQKGKHTTTRACLHHLPSGGNIIDSPGIREFGLWHITPAEAEKGFKEFAPFLGKCKFRNCTHQNNSPGCALTDAVLNDKIHLKRFESFLRLLDEIATGRE